MNEAVSACAQPRACGERNTARATSRVSDSEPCRVERCPAVRRSGHGLERSRCSELGGRRREIGLARGRLRAQGIVSDAKSGAGCWSSSYSAPPCCRQAGREQLAFAVIRWHRPRVRCALPLVGLGAEAAHERITRQRRHVLDPSLLGSGAVSAWCRLDVWCGRSDCDRPFLVAMGFSRRDSET